MTTGAFDQTVSLLFLDDGVYQLKSGQQSEKIGVLPVTPLFEALSLYGIEDVYIERESLEERGMKTDQLVIPVCLIERLDIQALIQDQDFLVEC